MSTPGYPAPQQPARPPQRLTRSAEDKWIGGVCGGLAQRFGLDSNVIRALFVISVLLPGPQVLLYLLLWLIIPAEPR